MQSDSDNDKRELEDQRLVQRALEGDPDSFVVLCQRYFPALVALVDAVLMDHHLAEDAAQETLVRAYRQLTRLKQPAAFGSWVGAICRHVAKDMLRSQLKHRRSLQAEPEPTSGYRSEGHSDLLSQALRRLSPSLREVIFLRYYNEKSYEQMAGILGISEQAVDGRLRRAKKKLAAYMQDRGFQAEVSYESA